MTLLGVQARFREIGRLRSGEVRFTKDGKPYPASLTTWRFTSQDKVALDGVAHVYGGEVEAWDQGHGWQVTTDSDSINVMLPPKGAAEQYSLNYELWSGGGLQRRCDGRDAVIGGEDSVCICDPDARDCAPTLRVSLLLPDVPGLGTWRLESKGYNAAAELPGSLNLLSLWSDAGRPARAVLRLEQRQSKVDGKVKKYVVPTIDIAYSMNELMARPIDAGPAEPLALPASGSGQDDSPPVLSDEQIEARYVWGEKQGFDRARLDTIAADAVQDTVPDMDDATWRGLAIAIKGGAFTVPTEEAEVLDMIIAGSPDAPPDAPRSQDGQGGTETPVVAPDATLDPYAPLPTPAEALAARIARAEARGRGEIK